MAPPPVTIYITSLTSQPRVRQHIELLHRSLRGLEIPYEAFDLVMDEQAKARWQRAKPQGQVIGLPGYLVGGEWVGTMDDFEQAVETATLPQFLKQDIDIDSSHGNTSGNIAEAELESLMREMTDGDLDKLAGEIGVDENIGKVGLIATPPSESAPVISNSPRATSPVKSVASPVASTRTGTGRRASLKDKEEVAREMREAGTVDGLMAAVEKAEGKEKVD